MVKLVLDTNVLINADRGEGNYGKRILDLVNWGEVEALISEPVKREKELILNKLVKDRALLKSTKKYFALAKSTEPVDIELELDDIEDMKLLELAVGGGADFLITNDNHLLVLGEFMNTKIITPKEFWQWWEVRQDATGNSWLSWAKQVLGK